jgi:hypothetical protein
LTVYPIGFAEALRKMNNMINRIAIFLVMGIVAGCGGSGAFTQSSSSAATGGTTGSSSSTTVRIGNGAGAGFTAGVLALGVSSLSAGGSTSVTANLVDASGNPYTTSTDVTFNSTCVGQQTAALTSPVTTATGSAVSTYIAKGCEGTDTITATATVDGGAISASVNISVLAANLGSIQFVSATPANIALKGTGGAGLSETSTVVFKVLNSVGGVVPNKDVSFSLDTTVGGLSISPATAKTDANGLVQTVVQAGTIPTPVRVTATVVGASPAITTQSDQLAITTGIPTERNMSLSLETLNPEAWLIDGVKVAVTARLADRFNNPVPDGTAVTFTAEGGSIGGSCTTISGACSVDWVSQNYRPSDGRVTIMASASGEESFVDVNGNGEFDDADSFPAQNDLPEAYRDDNENGSHDSGEFFVDYNQNGSYDAADGKFNGILCTHSTLCSTSTKLIVWGQNVLVMSDSYATIAFTYPVPPSTSINVSGGAKTVTFTVGDYAHNQPMPKGTTIAISTDNGKLSGPTSYTVGNTNFDGPGTYSISVATDGTSSTGTLTVLVTSPGQAKSYATISVTD